jgi:hypothetical protein
MTRLAAAMLLAGLSCLPSISHAQMGIEELFYGEAAELQDPGELQITIRSDVTHRARAETRWLGALVAEMGVLDGFQVEGSVPVSLVFPRQAEWEAGVGNVELGSAVSLYRAPRVGTLLAAGFEASFPTGSTDADEEAYELETFLSLHARAGDLHLHATGSVEVALPSRDDPALFGLGVALAVYAPLGPVVPVLEVAVNRSEETILTLAPALVWPVTPWSELSTSLGVQWEGGVPVYRGGVMFTVEAPLLASDDDELEESP